MGSEGPGSPCSSSAGREEPAGRGPDRRGAVPGADRLVPGATAPVALDGLRSCGGCEAAAGDGRPRISSARVRPRRPGGIAPTHAEGDPVNRRSYCSREQHPLLRWALPQRYSWGLRSEWESCDTGRRAAREPPRADQVTAGRKQTRLLGVPKSAADRIIDHRLRRHHRRGARPEHRMTPARPDGSPPPSGGAGSAPATRGLADDRPAVGRPAYWRAMCMRISLSASTMRSPDRSTVTLWRVPVKRKGAW